MENILTVNNIWMMCCTILVFSMHMGFSLLEIGLTRQKNSVNILFKNVFTVCVGLLLYFVVGFNLMYPGEFNGVIGFSGFLLDLPTNGNTAAYADGGYTFWIDFLFQGMFATAAASVISGAIAERIKIESFLLFTVFYVGIVYPIVGSWHWGGGFLSRWGFYDFAGSSIVHAVGGWAALVAIIMLGPRIGKYKANGQVRIIPGHNIPMATVGVFVMWLGWFGFNGGSVLSADPSSTSLVLVNTTLAAAAGGVGAFSLAFRLYKNYDLTIFLNGILGGLVSVTAAADLVSPLASVLIGFIAGVLVTLSVVWFDRLHIDDPVGALPVHLVCGIWGTLVVGIFGAKAGVMQFFIQLLGVFIIGVFCLLTTFLILSLIKRFMGLRVDKVVELDGLDLHEHGIGAYADFRMNQH
ncbi:MAG: ammonium transporter [Flavobacteriaceae bacterium]|nr:ammonium transporter [Flavobacteriaceae bacterium]